ncbi:MAG: alpha/beta fold hydrolase [Minicystis sp.]
MPASPFLVHHALVTAPGASPTRHLLMLHGILGSGVNLRSFARRLAVAHPAWGFVLADLRMHGLSQGAPPPHTVERAAEDLLHLDAHLPRPIDAVLGHSFGGKVALAYVAKRRGELDHAFLLDASPSRKPHGGDDETSAKVLRMLRALPDPIPSRERFFALVAEHGFPRSIAEWLAMNVRQGEKGLHFSLDLDAIGALLADYFAVDLWPVLEEPGHARAFHVVLGGLSTTVDEASRARLAALPWIDTTVIEGAGHWLHVDAPDALFAVVSRALLAP